MADGYILAACASSVYVFIVFCTVYALSVPSTLVRKLTKVLVTMLLLTSNVACKKAISSCVNRLFINCILRDLLAADCNFHCKYSPLLRIVNGHSAFQKCLKWTTALSGHHTHMFHQTIALAGSVALAYTSTIAVPDLHFWQGETFQTT